MLHHPAPLPLPPPYQDDNLGVDVHAVKATLIVAPETLRQQWIDEINLHAPSLAVYSFHGWQAAGQDVANSEYETWPDFAQSFDVIITTFERAQKELNVAKKHVRRELRHPSKYEKPRSPLVQLHFHRICMDEVQMLGSQTRGAALTISMIHRTFSTAVSGTPVKSMEDLRSGFSFLRVPGMELLWAFEHICSGRMRFRLIKVLGMIASRHTKAQVKNEMSIPPQTRRLVPVEFTSIEQAFYSRLRERLMVQLGFCEDKTPPSRTEALHLDDNMMREALLRLRQSCTHPHIVLRADKDSIGSSFNLRSIDDVLDLMLEKARSDWSNARSAIFRSQIDSVSVLLQDKDQPDRHLQATDTLNSTIDTIREQLARNKDEADSANLVGPLYRLTESDIQTRAASGGGDNDEFRARRHHLNQVAKRRREVSRKSVKSCVD